jgi:hypothetical protein
VYGPATDTRVVCQDIRAALADRALSHGPSFPFDAIRKGDKLALLAF